MHLVAQLATAITLLRRSGSLRQQANVQTALLELSRSLNEESDEKAILQCIGHHAKRVVGAERCSLFLYEKAKQQLVRAL